MNAEENLWYQNKKINGLVSGGRTVPVKLEVTDFDGESRTYTRLFVPHQRLILLGGGHIAGELCHLAARLDFDVIVVDDREEFASRQRFPEAGGVICGEFCQVIETLGISPYDYVAIMTRGHACDGSCLRKILDGTFPRYLGMVGSTRKAALIRETLLREGYKAEVLDQVHAPIGMAIGARTPGEIAVSILGQLISCRNEKTPREEGLLDYCNSDEKLLRFMENTQESYVLAVVMEKCGSTPVAGGAVMAVNRQGIAGGTVGGGLGEFRAAREAKQVLDDGKSRMIRVNMTNQDAASQGMICGGTLKIWLEYCRKPVEEAERD